MKNELLKKVDETLTERGEQYGDNLPEIARRWSILFGKEISRAQVCLAMMELKMVRLGQNNNSIDSFVDICGYACLSRKPLGLNVDSKEYKRFWNCPDPEEIDERADINSQMFIKSSELKSNCSPDHNRRETNRMRRDTVFYDCKDCDALIAEETNK